MNLAALNFLDITGCKTVMSVCLYHHWLACFTGCFVFGTEVVERSVMLIKISDMDICKFMVMLVTLFYALTLK